MGKRSRKRGDVAASTTTRAERDAARQRRAAALERNERTPRRRPGKTSFEDRPPAPWGSFPLVEIVILIGIVLLVAGFFVQGERGATMIVAGLALASLAGLELTIREHFAGFRSHSTLLAGAVAALAIAVTVFATRNSFIALGVAVVVFGAGFWFFRRVFARRSGGVVFRR